LEFKSIFVAGLEESLFPSFMSLDTPEGLDEERRLFYVAVTRAEELLTISYSTSRYRFGKLKYCEPSRFLQEIHYSHLEMTGSMGLGMSNGRRPQPPQHDDKPLTRISGAPISRVLRGGNSAPQKSTIDLDNFMPSPAEDIRVGMTVFHLKFGEGKVKMIDGPKESLTAVIYFKDVQDKPEKTIILKFAKLQIIPQ
jgi:DNA helicase-2/ATP-dependent DNA helicase PcrA